MVMYGKITIILALAAVVIVAGCAQKSTGDVHAGYPGATITDFSPIAPSIKAGTPINFYLTAQNFGYADATNANVILFNCGAVNTGASSGKTAPYKCNDELFEKDFTLQKPDASFGLPGESREADITLDTGKTAFPQGRTTQTFSARITYDYSTSGTRDVFFTTFDNWREKGGSVAVPPLNYHTDQAPLSLVINVPDAPIILNTDEQEFTVGVSIRNTGGGFTQNKELNEIRLCYDKAFVAPILEGTTYGDFENNDGNCLKINKGSQNAKLIGLDNQYKDVDARFKTVKGAIAVQDTTTFTAKVSYTYSLDTSTTVNIQNS
ncbi:TPA: hypothetical protein H1012_01375 [archaeon]|nr:hypothetical protein [Candidatus Naiadarchaeales archaeon SRR2090159.bin1288]